MLLRLDEREDLSPEGETLAEVLTLLIEDDDQKFHPLPHVSPNESLTALMEERGLNHKDIWPVQQGTSETSGGVLPRTHQSLHLISTLETPAPLG